MLRQHFPHVRKVILQSDNAKTFGGNMTSQLLPLVARAAGLECIGTGKDVCDTHQQAKVNATLVKAVVEGRCRLLSNLLLLWQQS